MVGEYESLLNLRFKLRVVIRGNKRPLSLFLSYASRIKTYGQFEIDNLHFV